MDDDNQLLCSDHRHPGDHINRFVIIGDDSDNRENSDLSLTQLAARRRKVWEDDSEAVHCSFFNGISSRFEKAN